MKKERLVFLLSAPSGTGKTTIIRKVLTTVPGLRKIVTTTSRPPREGEASGVDYAFVSREQFEAMIRNDEFIEWKDHFGHLYGLTWAQFKQQPRADAIFDMDVFGKDEFIGRVHAKCITIFLAPPSIDTVEQRIRQRGGDSEVAFTQRLGRVLEEMKRAGSYDYVVVNRDVDHTVSEIRIIVDRARAASRPSTVKYVAVEGLIGAGKTTLTQVLGAHLGAKVYLDPFDRNPFLADFYLSKQRFALETELSFALLRYRLMQRIREELSTSRVVVGDFTMWRSRVFASVNLNRRARKVFDGVYNLLAADLPAPDLVVWLEAPFELLLGRIKTRGRAEEVLGIDERYLHDVAAQYDRILKDEAANLIVLNANDVDLIRSSRSLRSLVKTIDGGGLRRG